MTSAESIGGQDGIDNVIEKAGEIGVPGLLQMRFLVKIGRDEVWVAGRTRAGSLHRMRVGCPCCAKKGGCIQGANIAVSFEERRPSQRHKNFCIEKTARQAQAQKVVNMLIIIEVAGNIAQDVLKNVQREVKELHRDVQEIVDDERRASGVVLTCDEERELYSWRVLVSWRPLSKSPCCRNATRSHVTVFASLSTPLYT